MPAPLSQRRTRDPLLPVAASSHLTAVPPTQDALHRAAQARTSVLPPVALALLGVLLTLGQYLGGGYDPSRWGVATVVAAVLAIALVVARPWRPDAAGLLLLGSLASFAVLSLLSRLWAESAPATTEAAVRWSFYAMVAAIGLWGMPSARARHAFLIGAGATAATIAVITVARFAAGSGRESFLVMRLTQPLDYVNGQAAVFLLTLWPALAAAERSRAPAQRGVGAGVATLSLGLLLLTQSRGGFIALVASILIVVAIVPGRLRRCGLLVVVFAGFAAAARSLNAVYRSSSPDRGLPTAGALQHAGIILLVAAVVVALTWAVISWVVLTRLEDRREPLRQATGAALAVGVVVAVVGSLIAVGNPIDRVRTQIDQFTTLSTDLPSQDRLLAGTSNRYDYWRVAIDEWRDAPVGGVGAGNYPLDYSRLRGTEEDVRQPHSLELQALSELGLLGFAAVIALLVALAWACVAAARGVARGTRGAGPTVAAVGMVATWAVQTSVDWMHLLTSITALALLAGTTLVGGRVTSGSGRARLPLTIVALVAVVVAAVGASRIVLADRALSRASEVLSTDPQAAVNQANRSLALRGQDLNALYIRAAALARMDDYEASRATLLEAARLEPSNFVPYALLGDLSTRRGDLPEARAMYVAAVARNPRNTVLRDDLTSLGVEPPPLPPTP